MLPVGHLKYQYVSSFAILFGVFMTVILCTHIGIIDSLKSFEKYPKDRIFSVSKTSNLYIYIFFILFV